MTENGIVTFEEPTKECMEKPPRHEMIYWAIRDLKHCEDRAEKLLARISGEEKDKPEREPHPCTSLAEFLKTADEEIRVSIDRTCALLEQIEELLF